MKYTRGWMRTAAWVVGVGGAGSLSGVAWGQGFVVIPPAEGYTYASPRALSADGGIVGGSSTRSGASLAFTWTAEGGRVDIREPLGNPIAGHVLGVSADGSSMAGQVYGGQEAGYDGFRIRASGVELLPPVAGYDWSRAVDIDANGDVAVGTMEVEGGFAGQAVRWDAAGTPQLLGWARPGEYYSYASAVSADGNTVVGTSYDLNRHDAFIWRPETGMQPLAHLAESPEGVYYANDITPDGRTVLGRWDGGIGTQPVLWADGVPRLLLLDQGFTSWNGAGITADASMFVGQVRIGNDYHAAVWTESEGFQLLTDYLAGFGIAVPEGLVPQGCNAVSEDGRTILGYGLVEGMPEGFVVTIPGPGGFGMVAAGVMVCGMRRRKTALL